MSSHIDIGNQIDKFYWILYNTESSRYLSGITEPGQKTEASHDWSIFLNTTDQEEWITECENLSIPHDE